MRITGFDLGQVGGWFKLDTERMSVDYGIFEAPKGRGEKNVGPRLVRLQRRIDEILADRPDLVTFEDVTFVQQAHAGKLVPVQMVGVLRMRLEQLGLLGAGVNVSSLKKFATGKGGSKKNPVEKWMMVAALQSWWGQNLRMPWPGDDQVPGHVADAAWTTIWGWQEWAPENMKPAYTGPDLPF